MESHTHEHSYTHEHSQGEAPPPAYGAVEMEPEQKNAPDYTINRAFVPGILLIIVGVVNGIMFIVAAAVLNVIPAEYIVGFFFYLACGILGVVGAVKKPGHQAIPISLIVATSISLIFGFAQIIINGLAASGAALAIEVAQSMGYPDYLIQLYVTTLGIAATLLVAALLVIILAIVLMVFASKVVCGCCGDTILG